MADLPLEQVPRESEIIEVLYRRSGPAESHIDLTVSDDGTLRRLRFNGARVVQFQEQPPDVLKGLDVEDIRDQKLGDLTLWVSIAGGAITFWAKTITEIAEQKPQARPAPRDRRRTMSPLVAARAGARVGREWDPAVELPLPDAGDRRGAARCVGDRHVSPHPNAAHVFNGATREEPAGLENGSADARNRRCRARRSIGCTPCSLAGHARCNSPSEAAPHGQLDDRLRDLRPLRRE